MGKVFIIISPAPAQQPPDRDPDAVRGSGGSGLWGVAIEIERGRSRTEERATRALPQIVRDAFFFTNGKLGVAAQVFVKGVRVPGSEPRSRTGNRTVREPHVSGHTTVC